MKLKYTSLVLVLVICFTISRNLRKKWIYLGSKSHRSGSFSHNSANKEISKFDHDRHVSRMTHRTDSTENVSFSEQSRV